MNDKIEQLRILRDRLEALKSDCAVALKREKTIAGALDQALSEARRIYGKVNEGRVEAVSAVSDRGFLDHSPVRSVSNNLGSIMYLD